MSIYPNMDWVSLYTTIRDTITFQGEVRKSEIRGQVSTVTP